MGVEHFVVGIMHAGAVHAGSFYFYVRFVAGINDFFIVAGAHEDDGRLIRKVGDEVQRSLHRVEIPLSAGIHNQGVGGCRRGGFGGECPCIGLCDAFEFSAWKGDGAFVDGHVIGFPVFQHVVVRVDGGDGVAHDDGMEVESVGEPADDVQLVFMGCGLCHARRRAWTGILVGRDIGACVIIWNLCVVAFRPIGPAFRGACGDAQVEAVYQTVCAGLVDADHSRIVHNGLFFEKERQVCVGVDVFRIGRNGY